MAESTLRENGRGATHQLAAQSAAPVATRLAAKRNQALAMVLVQDPFYRHDSLGPGAPLREITGFSEQAGFYDWAGRRLFLADGEPDPMCAGAYRYQHNPDCCDTEAPDSDPRSPRYEPMHLRHKAGDTWIIDTNRPYDPYDPGPYGSHSWYKDQRTGRHRRDELPDPLPAEDWVTPKDAWFPGTADWPEPVPPQRNTSVRSRPRDDDDRPWSGRRASDSERPVRRRPRVPDQPTGEAGGYRFSKLREDAFDRFMIGSAELRAAHFQPEGTYLRERMLWALRWALAILTCGLAPAPVAARASRCERPAPQPGPMQSTIVEAAPTIPAQRPPSSHVGVAAGPLPGSAMAAAIGGARAARTAITARSAQTSTDLAAAVRNSASAIHWHTPARQDRPRPKPVPYMTAWESAFDTTALSLITGKGCAA